MCKRETPACFRRGFFVSDWLVAGRGTARGLCEARGCGYPVPKRCAPSGSFPGDGCFITKDTKDATKDTTGPVRLPEPGPPPHGFNAAFAAIPNQPGKTSTSTRPGALRVLRGIPCVLCDEPSGRCFSPERSAAESAWPTMALDRSSLGLTRRPGPFPGMAVSSQRTQRKPRRTQRVL